MQTHTTPEPQGRVVIRDAESRRWLEFTAPCQVMTTSHIEEVGPLISRIDERVQNEGLHAAGFISYEAAPGFDPCLPAKKDGCFPLIWFGLFEQVNEINIEQSVTGSAAAITWRPSIPHAEYRRGIQAIHDHIRAGDTYQVNFTYRLRARTEIEPWHLFVEIAGDATAPYAAFVDTGEWAICSASPELFLRLDDELLQSRPMKGTAARGLWFEDDLEKRARLISSMKERAENLMIVDMVRNDLGRVAMPGSVHVPSLLTTEKYPSVWQLTSTVQARTSASLKNIFQATFPPASITGAPKRRTMEIIAELESSPRRIYTGTIGYVAPCRRAQFNVAIRTVLAHKPSGYVEYGVGGGVLWDSTAADEYKETQTKTRALTPLPRNFDLLETMLFSSGSGYWLLEYHLQRLMRSAEYFDFQAAPQIIRKKLARFASRLPPGHHRVRLRVSRQGRIQCDALAQEPSALSFGNIVPAKNPVQSQDLFLYHKTTRRSVYEEAVRKCPGSNDVLLYNQAGEVTETTVANVAVEIDGVLYTPPLRCGLLPGTLRACLLEQARLRERVLTMQEVLSSPNVYLLNSVRGMHKVHVHGPEEKNGPHPGLADTPTIVANPSTSEQNLCLPGKLSA